MSSAGILGRALSFLLLKTQHGAMGFCFSSIILNSAIKGRSQGGDKICSRCLLPCGQRSNEFPRLSRAMGLDEVNMGCFLIPIFGISILDVGEGEVDLVNEVVYTLA